MNPHPNLVRCGLVAGPLFLATATVQGALRRDYDQLRHPISSLALGPLGWVQRVNFATTGALYLAAAVGLSGSRRDRPVAALGITGAALAAAAAFSTDPVSGYPPGTPDIPLIRTHAGLVHDLTAVPIFLGLPVLQLTTAVSSGRRGHRLWAAGSAVSAAGMLAGLLGSTAGFSAHTRWLPYGGLFQRLAVVSGLGWLTALTARTLGTEGI